jgi:3-dehydroquinate synthase
MASTIINEHYNIYINERYDVLGKSISEGKYSKVFVIVDQNTEQYCLPHILEYLPESSVIIQIEDGEKNKNLQTSQFIWNALLNNQGDRHSLIINLGGGVIGDMGGFCASTFMRGIDFINIPTTLLAQVDSSVGSKLGVDLNGVKNIIGVFNHPKAVIINTDFLKTLPYKEILSGYAEIIKHSLIADATLWYEILDKQKIESQDFETYVTKNVKIKNDVVTQDPLEIALRKILNFGHTMGHAIETSLMNTNYSLLHGEAIAIGMVCESYLSFKKGYISLEDCHQIKSVIHKLYGNKNKSLPSFDSLLNIMKHDKKNKSGNIYFSLLESIGKGNYNQLCSEDEIRQSLDWYRKGD